MKETAKQEEPKVTKQKTIKRRLKGVVVSNKMQNTIAVRVERLKMHPIYKKKYKVSKNYKVDDSKNQYQIDDVVEFIECRPLSKDKRWRVVYNNQKS